jgi:hypothetical protein
MNEVDVGKGIAKFLCGALLLVAVAFGVAEAVSSNNNNGATMPTMAPTASPNMAPTASPTTLEFAQLLNLIEAGTSDINFLQDRTTLQYEALDWLANVDAWEVDMDSVPSQVFVERYVLALLFLSTNGYLWRSGCNFLTPTSVCEWNNGRRGVFCDEDDLIVALSLGNSKHKEVDWFILLA